MTSIGVSAFENCSNLTSAAIPSSVTGHIGTRAFSSCGCNESLFTAGVTLVNCRVRTGVPTAGPTSRPTASPTVGPTTSPTAPTVSPTTSPTTSPTAPTFSPTTSPIAAPTVSPTTSPIAAPTVSPATTAGSNNLSAGRIAGLVIAGIVASAAIGYALHRRCRNPYKPRRSGGGSVAYTSMDTVPQEAEPAADWLLGVSIHHLVAVILPQCPDALRDRIKATRDAGLDLDSKPPAPWRPPLDLADLATATIWHMVHAYVMPATEDEQCSYVQHLQMFAPRHPEGHSDHCGESAAMLSYTWGDPYQVVIMALEEWSIKQALPPKKTNVWICSLCVNQHCMPNNLTDTFSSRVEAIGRLLPLLTPWKQPLYTTRIWCLYEFWTTSTKPSCTVEVIFTAEDVAQMRTESTRADNEDNFETVLESIDCESATCSMECDRIKIRREIHHSGCAFPALDTAVREGLRKQFMAQLFAMLNSNSAPSRRASRASSSLPPIRQASPVSAAADLWAGGMASGGGGGIGVPSISEEFPHPARAFLTRQVTFEGSLAISAV